MMNLNKEFKTLVVPIIKGSPILIGVLAVAIIVARRLVIYSNPIYQTDVAIKIDNRDYGINNFYLFNEEGGPKQSLSSAFLTEVELLKTRSLKEHTFEKLDFFASYYRVGKVKTAEIYYDSPFFLDFEVADPTILGKKINLQYDGNGGFWIDKTEKAAGKKLVFGVPYADERFEITLKKNEKFWKEKTATLQKGDVFAFELHNLEDLAKSVDASNLFIKPIDKEITIVKIYYKHEVPEKAALFVNAFADTYIEEAKRLRNTETTQTIEFIENELTKVEAKLKEAEGNLALFKKENSLVNTNQETDAVLKELTALDLRKVDYDLQQVELSELYDFLESNADISSFSPNFKTVNDALFEDAFLKLKTYESQRADLLQRYTSASTEVQAIQAKITSSRSFLLQTIRKKLDNLRSQRTEVENSINEVNEKLRKYPDKQKKIAELERDVALAAQTYTYLNEKRMELSIAQSSSFVLHRIIDYAPIPEKPSAPNKSLIYGLAIFMALLFSLILIYVWHYFTSNVETKDDIKDLVQAPVISTISQVKKTHFEAIEPFLNLYTNLNILQKNRIEADAATSIGTDSSPSMLVMVSSIMPNEGRTFVSVGLARAMAHFNRRTVIVDLDKRKPKAHRSFELPNNGGLEAILRDNASLEAVIQPTSVAHLDILVGGENLSDLPDELVFSPKTFQLIEKLKSNYDCIIVDLPPTAAIIEGVAFMHEADFNLFMVQAFKSRVRFVKHINTFLEEYKVPNFFIVLNGVRQKSGFYAQSYRLGLRRRLINFLNKQLMRGRIG